MMVRLLKKIIPVCLEVFKDSSELCGYKKGVVTHNGNCGIHSLQVCVNGHEDTVQAREIRAYLKSLFSNDMYDGQTDPIKQLMRAEIKEMVLNGEGGYCQAFKAQGLYHSSVDQINALNQQVVMQRWSLINSIFGRELNDADIATEYSQWDRASQSTAGSEPPAKKTRLEHGLKELFFEDLKQAIDEENSRRVQSGKASMTSCVDAIKTVFKEAIEKIETDNDEFNGVKDAFLRNHQQIKEYSDRLQSDEMAEEFLQWNTNFGNLFGTEIEKPSYYLTRWSIALVAHQLNCNMQLVLGDEGAYITPEEYRVVLNPGTPMNYVHFNGINQFNPMIKKDVAGSSSSSSSSSRSVSPISMSSGRTESDRVLDPRLNEIFDLKELELYPYQIQAIQACLKDLESTKKSLLIAATGLGKTIMTYVTLLIRALTHPGKLNVVLNNQKALVKQLSDEYAYKFKCPLPLFRYLDQKYEMFDPVHGLWRDVDKNLVESELKEGGFYFSTVQSILSDERKEQWKKYEKNGVKVDTVFFDEAHHLGETNHTQSVKDDAKLSGDGFVMDEAQEFDDGQEFIEEKTKKRKRVK